MTSFVKLFDIYIETLEDEILKDKIIELLSNKLFVINRIESIREFIKQLKIVATLENQSSNNQTTKNLDALFQIITSKELLNSRVTEEHLEVVKYFVYSFDADQSYKMLGLYTDWYIVKNRYGDAHLFILDLYNKLALHNEDSSELVVRLFTDKKIYQKLSIDFQIYLIEILQEINDPDFLKELESILTLENKNLSLVIKKRIKEYTNYTKTVKQIINSYHDGKNAVDVIAAEAREENINEITGETKLVLIPHHDITDTIDNLKKVISSK